jgi:hypothetical protein
MVKPHRFVSLALLATVALCSSHAAHANAPPGRYSYPLPGIVNDVKTNLTWQRAIDVGPYDLASATAYCAALTLGGFGWRVPTVKELVTLVDVSMTDASLPTIDPTAFPMTPNTYFWSSTPLPDGSSNWSVSFGSGIIVAQTTTLVRCVER